MKSAIDCYSQIPKRWINVCVNWTRGISRQAMCLGHGTTCTSLPESQWFSITTHSWPGNQTLPLVTRSASLPPPFHQLPSPSPQCLRATNFIRGAVLFRNSLEDGQLEPDMFHLQPEKSDNELFRNIVR